MACFLCNGPHRVAECPLRDAFNALQAFIRSQEPMEVREGAVEEREDSAQVGALKFLNALNRQVIHAKKTNENGFIFMDAVINGNVVKSMVLDTNATHNFCSKSEARKFSLSLHKDAGQMKAVNSKALPTVGLAKQVPLKLRSSKDCVDLIMVEKRIDYLSHDVEI